MNIKQAAINTLVLWNKNTGELPEAGAAKAGNTLEHQHYVLLEIISENVVGDKAHRWLGWAQGWLSANGCLSLEDCKYANVLS